MGVNTIENAEMDSADEPEDMDTDAENVMDTADEDEVDMDEEITDSNDPDADDPDKDVTDTDIIDTAESDTDSTESDNTEDTDSDDAPDSGVDTAKQEETADDSGTVQTDH